MDCRETGEDCCLQCWVCVPEPQEGGEEGRERGHTELSERRLVRSRDQTSHTVTHTPQFINSSTGLQEKEKVTVSLGDNI